MNGSVMPAHTQVNGQKEVGMRDSVTGILSRSPSTTVCALAAHALSMISDPTVLVLSGPKVAMVQLRIQESVADTVFNGGEVLVTETRLELNGVFGFGMVIGDQPEYATALAVLDALGRIDGPHRAYMTAAIADLGRALTTKHQSEFAASNSTKVAFDTF
jgi:alpha-D-ribose 1-methylphosphonate 5-triphosphate synthase subunit PhnG